MDSSADTRTDFDTYLPEMLLETVLTLINIESFFSSIVSDRLSCKKRLFFRLKQNKLTFGLLSQFTPKMEQVLFDSGSCLANTQVSSLLKTFIENRELLIVSLFGKFVLVTKSEILELLGIKVKRKLEEGTLIKRRIDCDIFIALLINNSVHEVETDNLYKNKPLADDILQEKDILSAANRNITNVTLKLTSRGIRTSNVSAVVQRRPHKTTLIDLEIIAYPNEGKKYNNPKYPKVTNTGHNPSVDKYSTQVTETDAGQLSLKPYIGRGSSSSAGSELSGSEPVNVYSVPGISYERQTAINKNIVTSGTGFPFHTKPPKYKEYLEQQQRQASFNTMKWTVDNKPDSSILAECGFFFTGNQDLVRCHQCGIGLKDWSRDDDVLTEHVRHSTSCDFLVRNYGRNTIHRLKLALTSDDINETASVDPTLPYKIRSPRYQTMEARLMSFKDFPKNIKLTAQQLAVAGLYFTGKGDLCRCFTCDGGLKDWSSGDDPIKEHATYFPNCSYINQLKGSEYIKSQQRNNQRNEPMGATGGSSTISQPTQSSPNLPIDRLTIAESEYSSFNVSQVVQKMGYAEVEVNTAKNELERKGNKFPTADEVVNTLLDMQERAEHFQNVAAPPENKAQDLQAMADENKKLSRLIFCMLCVTGEADILFLPCTHHRTCHECAADLVFCPVCNEFIKEKVKTFRS